MPQPELIEPVVTIVPMIDGRDVVENYAHVGLTLRQHPVTFLRDELRQHGIMPCADLLAKHDGRRVTVAGFVLVRQRPGVIFITLEDETGIANLVIWSSLFERPRGVVLSASMLECRCRVQREGDVINVVAEELSDLIPYSVPWTIETGRGPTAKGSKLLSSRAASLIRPKWRTPLATVLGGIEGGRGRNPSFHQKLSLSELSVSGGFSHATRALNFCFRSFSLAPPLRLPLVRRSLV
jgi:hypothetical protein